ncbi:four helix bundle protein [Shewanella khirikhana]
MSIASNIAEGEERETQAESARFFYFSKGSTGELVTQLYIAIEIGVVEK